MQQSLPSIAKQVFAPQPIQSLSVIYSVRKLSHAVSRDELNPMF
jgi:hypothetical protein